MHVAHIALGGCLKGPPVSYGLTGDTGGHIAYVLGAATTQSALAEVSGVTIVTRLFEGPGIDRVHAMPIERLSDKLVIRRIATGNRAYLEKEALAGELAAFTAALLATMADAAGRPDVIHAHFADAAHVALAIRDRFGIPFFYTPHSLILQKARRDSSWTARAAEERRAIAGADGIIVSSHDEADRQVSAYRVDGAGRRLHRLPPGPPLAEVEDGPVCARTLLAALDDPGRPLILTVARPVRKKNLVALAQAFAARADLRAVANLVVLAGQPDLRAAGEEERAVLAELDAVLSDPSLRGSVVRLGHHTRADVQALYRLAAATGGVFVNPALHEPFGLTLLEAAAVGLPVVATRNGGAGEIVTTVGHGILVDPEDRDAIADACRRIVVDPALHRALSRAALGHGDHFSWASYARRSLELYAEASRTRRRISRLVVCDIDGTLTGCTAAAARFARWAASRGDVGFVVATGRALDEARAVLAAWHLPEPDAYITEVGTVIHRRGHDGRLERWAGFAAEIDEGWDRQAVQELVARLDLAAQGPANQNAHKLSVFGAPHDAVTAEAMLAAAGLAARVVFSHERYLDILAPRAGKGAAVAFYARSLGLDLADCVAAGDSGNDRDMLASCGLGIVVGNASADLDTLAPRPGLLRVGAHFADGVLEGLATAGLADRPEPGLAA